MSDCCPWGRKWGRGPDGGGGTGRGRGAGRGEGVHGRGLPSGSEVSSTQVPVACSAYGMFTRMIKSLSLSLAPCPPLVFAVRPLLLSDTARIGRGCGGHPTLGGEWRGELSETITSRKKGAWALEQTEDGMGVTEIEASCRSYTTPSYRSFYRFSSNAAPCNGFSWWFGVSDGAVFGHT